MLYHIHEMRQALLAPLSAQAELLRCVFQNPVNPASYTPFGRNIGATAEMLSRMTHRYTKPEFSLEETNIGGKKVAIEERIIAEKPFCKLLNFHRNTKRNDPKILLIAPISGHFATLLRGTVTSLLPHHDIYITDWVDARQVPLSEGKFDLDCFISYLRDFMDLLGPDTHVIAVCQPASMVLATASLMASDKDPNQPLTMTLMGGPIDTRVSKTEVTELAEERPIRWFENNVIFTVPPYYPGAGRRVYPGFLQLSGFVSMNLDTHIGSHIKFYHHLMKDDDASSKRHRDFYNEYMSVMDMDADFYLQTITEVFKKQSLPRGKMKWRDPRTNKLHDVRPQDIKHTALMTVEGELDDISARGQTTSAHELCHSLPQNKQFHHFQLGCGHYGIFNGSKWHNEVMPRIRNFIRRFDKDKDAIPEFDLRKVADISPERYDYDKHSIIAVRRWLKENRPENYKAIKCVMPHENDRKFQDDKLVPPPISGWTKPVPKAKDEKKAADDTPQKAENTPKPTATKATTAIAIATAAPAETKVKAIDAPTEKNTNTTKVKKPKINKDMNKPEKLKVIQESLPLEEPDVKSNVIQLNVAALKSAPAPSKEKPVNSSKAVKTEKAPAENKKQPEVSKTTAAKKSNTKAKEKPAAAKATTNTTVKPAKTKSSDKKLVNTPPAPPQEATKKPSASTKNKDADKGDAGKTSKAS